MIIAKDLGLQIEGNVILNDVSFRIKTGEYVGLIGPNGAGKTSLINVLMGFYKPTTGTLKLSSDVKIGYVPQSYTLSGVVPISVAEVLMMSGVKKKEVLIKNLAKVGLTPDFVNKKFHPLSGGQKQRVIIARALCLEPELLIFDEPLNGVDFETKIKMYELLSHLNKKEKLTILVVSHEVDQIIEQCHHILCLNKTMHTGCHPLNFAKGKMSDCPILETYPKLVPIHHHHNNDSSCSC